MTEDNWRDLLYAISKGKCLILLGAGTSTYELDGKTIPLTEGLAMHLFQLLQNEVRIEESEMQSLLYVATEFQQHKGLIRLHQEVEQFYKQHSRASNELLQLLSELPISLFINTAPDVALEKVYRSQFRDFRKANFSFRKEKRSESQIFDLEDPSPENPFIYNLFGSIDDPTSLVLTEKDRILFIQDIIQHNDSIPNAILKQLTTDKIVLFLGFDFEQWHLRILPKALLNADELEAPVLVPNGSNILNRGTMLFYKKQYKMDFLALDPTEFIRQLVDRWKKQNDQEVHDFRTNNPIEVLFMYDQADIGIKNELDKHLSGLKRNNSIRTWDENKLEPGASVDLMVGTQIERANLILLLVSADFLGNDHIYEVHLLQALSRYRQGKALICPILVRPCIWETAVFAKMPTVLPRNKKSLSEWDDKDAAYKHVAQQLESFIEKLLENLSL